MKGKHTLTGSHPHRSLPTWPSRRRQQAGKSSFSCHSTAYENTPTATEVFYKLYIYVPRYVFARRVRQTHTQCQHALLLYNLTPNSPQTCMNTCLCEAHYPPRMAEDETTPAFWTNFQFGIGYLKESVTAGCLDPWVELQIWPRSGYIG